MSAILELRSVSLSYPVYSARAQSLRNAIANFAVGGSFLKDGRDVVHINALDSVSFKLAEGDRLGIIGHNGAGKSTLLKVLAGIYEPDAGEVMISGRISSMLDINLGLDVELTGRENIITMGRMRGLTLKEVQSRVQGIIDFSDLGSYIDLPIKTYSSGMTTRLIFAVATSLDPDILLMDEWISAGDAHFVHKAIDRLNDIVNKSRVIVLASHDMGLIASLCNKIIVLGKGKQIFFGDKERWDFEKQMPLISKLA